MAGQPGFFDIDNRYAALSATGDPLERLAAVVDFEVFRPVLEAARAQVKIGIANLAYNFTRFAWLSTRAAPA